MTNSTKLTPELRFPEFAYEWQLKRLGDISSEVIDKVGDRNVETYSITAGVGFVSQTEKFGKDISGSQNPRYTMLSPNELSYNKGNSKTYQYGCVYRNPFDHEIAVPNVFISFKFSDGNSAGFYEQLFIGHYLDRYLRRIISSGARMDGLLNVGKRDFFDIKIPAPSKKEQEKIADFLTAVDEKIAKLEQKQASLEAYKRGVMQQIFSQKIRFTKPDGSNYPDWQAKKLGDISKVTGGGTPETSKQNYWGGDIAWLTPTEIKQKYIYDSKRKITQEGLDKSSAKILPIGTVIFTSRATVGDVAIARSEVTTNQGFQSLVPRGETDSEFLYYWAVMNKKKFLRLSSGSTFPEISKTDMLRVSVDFPDLEEQQKIADLLSAIDSKIQLNNDIIQKAKQFKKSLLQRMFV